MADAKLDFLPGKAFNDSSADNETSNAEQTFVKRQTSTLSETSNVIANNDHHETNRRSGFSCSFQIEIATAACTGHRHGYRGSTVEHLATTCIPKEYQETHCG